MREAMIARKNDLTKANITDRENEERALANVTSKRKRSA
jgi:hypothetical protein